MLYNWK